MSYDMYAVIICFITSFCLPVCVIVLASCVLALFLLSQISFDFILNRTDKHISK
jgi:hypothetical protein